MSRRSGQPQWAATVRRHSDLLLTRGGRPSERANGVAAQHKDGGRPRCHPHAVTRLRGSSTCGTWWRRGPDM